MPRVLGPERKRSLNGFRLKPYRRRHTDVLPERRGPTGQTVSCALGDLPGGSQAIIFINTTAPTDPQIIVNTASMASATPDRNAANDSVSVVVQIK